MARSNLARNAVAVPFDSPSARFQRAKGSLMAGHLTGRMAFTYILRCADETLYVGHTENLAARERTHNDGNGAKYTAARRPVRIVYAEEHSSARSAIARERQLKRWSH